MIATILMTMLVALGVATGNVSCNTYKGGNAFNKVEKQTKPKQNEINTQTYTITIDPSSADSQQNQYLASSDPNYPFTQIQNGYNYYITTYNLGRAANQAIDVEQVIWKTGCFTYNNNTNDLRHLIPYGHTSRNTYQQYYTSMLIQYKITPYFITVDNSMTVKLVAFLDNYYAFQNDEFELTAYVNLVQSNYNEVGSIYDNSSNIGRPLDPITKYNEIMASQYIQSQQNFTAKLNVGAEETNITTEIIINKNGNAISQEYIFIYYRFYINEKNGDQPADYGSFASLGASYTQAIAVRSTSIQGTMVETIINYEVVDIPNLMFTILTLPFSFISNAFNLTIFPGTPYQVNFANLFITIIGIFILLWLINHILK